ncbi:MAG: hypothetical protein AM326_03060 [Candidatus Thorarchaeota archaeon SMTZ-45]|nr:MAG: hypothetical protein AM326_03060 [Candidatus Thorarchaeota archaeon SMTZ-45]
MPLPSPNKDETRDAYVNRCVSFVHSESKEKVANAQAVAMCINNFNRKHKNLERKVFLHVHPTYKALGNALVVTGELLKPGIFIGLDGVPTRYTEEFINRVKNSIVGKPIRFAHKISPSPVLPEIEQGETVGFWTGVKRGKTLGVKGYVFNPIAIEYLNTHPNIGLSAEADVVTSIKPGVGIENAETGMLTGGVMIEDPACPTCRVTSTREVNLQSEEKVSDALSATTDTTGDSKPFIELVEEEGLKLPTRAEFLDNMVQQLTKAGIKEETIGKIRTYLEKGINSPIKVPKPSTQEAELLSALTVELAGDKQEDFKKFMEGCVPKDGIQKCVLQWKEKNQAAKPPEVPPPPRTAETPTEKEKELEDKLTQTKTELEGLKKVVGLQEKEKFEALTEDIKSYDKDFKAERFLEGVTCPVTKNKMLQGYLSVLKKHVKPINLQIGEEKARTQVKSLTDEMFGPNATFESIFGIKDEKGE